jgi:DhnA family fructose-bisphosphate aldolase class Ia
MAIAYARPTARQEPLRHGEGLDGAPAPCLHTHAALVARELGADAVKVLFDDDEDCLAATVGACWPVPVVVAGGAPISLDDWAERARRAIRAGARGFCVGRNVVQADEPLAVLGAVGRALREEPSWRA